jgi:hypothetical protein
MGKLILISILLSTVAVPVLGSTDARPRRGLGRTLAFLALFNAIWLALLTLVFAPSYKPELW